MELISVTAGMLSNYVNWPQLAGIRDNSRIFVMFGVNTVTSHLYGTNQAPLSLGIVVERNFTNSS